MPSRAFTTLFLTVAFFCCAQSPSPPKTESAQNFQTAYCPNTRQLEVSPSQKFFLQGTIGKRDIRMYLDRGGSGVVGLFFQIGGNWDTTLLGGTWKDGEIDASDEAENHPASGHLKASLADDRLTGTWTPANSGDAEPVNLATMVEPTCDSKAPWNRFEVPNSQVSFAYPASWRLDQDRDAIWLTCPDPSEIAYGQGVTIHTGPGAFAGPPELLQCGDKWIYGSECDCNHADEIRCHIAKETHSGAATVLDVGGHEWRVYCHDGGYVGQGYGEDRIVLLPHSWLEIIADGKASELIDRLVATVKERPSNQSK